MATEFQSRTFQSGFIKGEQVETFKKDLETINKLEFSKLEGLIDYTIKIIIASTKHEERKLADKAVKEGLIGNTEKLNSLNRFVNYFLDVFLEEKTKEDTPEKIFDDFSIKFGIDKSQYSTVKTLLEIIKKKVPEYGSEKRKKSYEVGVFPYLKGFNTTVELRGIFNKGLELGESYDSYIEYVKVDEQNPIVPIISVSISLSSETPDKFSFHTSPEHLKLLIEELKSSLHKSKLLKERFDKKS